MPADTTKVDRTTKWGNPFHVSPARDNAAAVGLFSDLIAKNGQWIALVRGRSVRVTAEDVRRELAGKNLACWCRPGLACHADVLLKVANSAP